MATELKLRRVSGRVWTLVVAVGVALPACLDFSELIPKDACGEIPKPREVPVNIASSEGDLPMFRTHGELVRSMEDDACFTEAVLELMQDDDCHLSMAFRVDPDRPTRLVATEVSLGAPWVWAPSSVCLGFPDGVLGSWEAADPSMVWIDAAPVPATIRTGCHAEGVTLHLAGTMVRTRSSGGPPQSFEFVETEYEIDVELDASYRRGSCEG